MLYQTHHEIVENFHHFIRDTYKHNDYLAKTYHLPDSFGGKLLFEVDATHPVHAIEQQVADKLKTKFSYFLSDLDIQDTSYLSYSVDNCLAKRVYEPALGQQTHCYEMHAIDLFDFLQKTLNHELFEIFQKTLDTHLA